MGYIGWSYYGPIQGVILAFVAVLASLISYFLAPHKVAGAIKARETVDKAKQMLRDLEGGRIKITLLIIVIFGIMLGISSAFIGLVFGFKFSLKTGLTVAAIYFVITAIFVWMIARLPHLSHLLEPAFKAPLWGVSFWVFPGWFFSESTAQTLGLAAAYWAGAPLVVYAVLRVGLVIMRLVPIHHRRFLDHAVQLAFLKKVGTGYIFSHRLLLEHLADRSKPAQGNVISPRFWWD